ncbi:MAG: hypothetical protein HYY16_03175 [Planctomycetes bacterium]|nr:hypothetical protein [Planctomycetota bacterium]
MSNDCLCPDGKCHRGRPRGKERERFCDKCIELWFSNHLKHRIEKMLKPEGAESKCIVMRSLMQFLGLSSSPNPCAKKFELALAGDYRFEEPLARWHGSTGVTYEVRADNLGSESFDDKALQDYKGQHAKEAELLARFHYGVHVHTAHLTWGANHSENGPIWNINSSDEDVVREICRLLKERVYKGRNVPWKS